MSEPIRSYQRIFRPERRIYQLEGRRLPIPGGLPLRWLGYAVAALVAVLAIGSQSMTVAAVVALGAGMAGLLLGGAGPAAVAAVAGFAGFWVAGGLLGLLDWPLRLVVVPVAVATLATQPTPDGRRADRFALSWISVRLLPRRRSLGRELPAAGSSRVETGSVWVAPDEHSPRLRRGRVAGRAVVRFVDPARIRRGGLHGRRRLVARPVRFRRRRGELEGTRVVVAEGETLEVRP